MSLLLQLMLVALVLLQLMQLLIELRLQELVVLLSLALRLMLMLLLATELLLLVLFHLQPHLMLARPPLLLFALRKETWTELRGERGEALRRTFPWRVLWLTPKASAGCPLPIPPQGCPGCSGGARSADYGRVPSARLSRGRERVGEAEAGGKRGPRGTLALRLVTQDPMSSPSLGPMACGWRKGGEGGDGLGQ